MGLLLVEDEAALRLLLARVLDRSGYTVDAAASGEEALALFEAAPERFAAAVVDLTLPGMSGDAAVAQLRALRPTLPIVVTSGLAAPPRGSLAGESVTFLQKPFLPARLVEVLAAALPATGPKDAPPPQSSSSSAS